LGFGVFHFSRTGSEIGVWGDPLFPHRFRNWGLRTPFSFSKNFYFNI
jgi:hypothetical protein